MYKTIILNHKNDCPLKCAHIVFVCRASAVAEKVSCVRFALSEKRPNTWRWNCEGDVTSLVPSH